ncbi:MarR family winged helix-turn-helix transcriptional regulator [Pseudalkalibacillus sp. A8]|uniref:MarR family winged helix-turn-helix transcriptional regulator n=1 Tax=Pseudalkalibacillus sp. A8 TaxID=3382641 RepID=UPI0038B5FF4A
MNEREKLIYALEKSFRKLLRAHRKNMTARLGSDLTASEFMFLQYLYESGPSKVSDLAEEFQVNLSHVTNVTDKLDSKNLITRIRSRSDRRIVELQMTAEGSKVLEKVRRKRNTYFKNRFKDLDDDEINQMINFFSKLKKAQ